MTLRATFNALLLCLLAGHPCVHAAEARPLLTDYTHTAWTELDGAPTGATKFAQGADGWLWIATPTGLYRFDGVHFERVTTVYGQPLASSNIMALTIAPDGAVWVGYRVGGVSVFRKDGAHTYVEADGLQPVGVMHIEVAPDGAVWAAMRDGLAILPKGGQRFQYLPADAGVPALGVFQVLFARDGTTWIGTNIGAFFRKRGDSRFTQAWPRDTALVALNEAPDGTIWANDFKHNNYKVRVTEPAAGVTIQPEFEGDAVRWDRRSTMWVTHSYSIERKLPGGGGDQHVSKSERLSGPMLGATFEDREGNLWIGTSRGVDRLRRNRLHTTPVVKQLEYPALVGGPDGEMWVGDYGTADLWSFSPDGRLRRQAEGALTASYTAPDGAVWLGNLDGVRRLDRDGSIIYAPFPNAVKNLRVHALQQDRHGRLWASFSAGKGVYQLSDGQWVKSGGRQGLSELLTTTMTLDHAGDLWLGHLRSQITVVGDSSVRVLGPAQGLQLGTILSLQVEDQTMWVGGENGVALYRNGRFTTLLGTNNEAFRGASGIVHIPGGDLWINGAEGLYRLAAADLAKWLKDERGSVAFERFDAQDGMQGHAPQLRPVPSLKRSRDGLLWYATTGGIGTIDPANILRNPLPPPVEVVGLLADGVRQAIPHGDVMALPQGTRDIQIDFTALGLSLPERVRLRYRLVGFDRAWQEPVGRRQAYYTNLAPGKYRFEVIASNEDNVWNDKGAVLEIDIPPTFVQSAWFKVLLVALSLLLLYAAYALRIRYLTQRLQERLHERLAERTRIARTLHDTLLQSMQSLLLSFDAHSRHLKEGTQERIRLDQTLNLAEQLLVEGRDQIMDLRACSSPEVLALTLEQFGKGLAEHRAHLFEIKVSGTARQLRADVHDEIYAIAREALFNASRYADASRITLEIGYSSSAFAMHIRDNGCGLDESVMASGCRPGHWGLQGMRERANLIGATLTIASEAGEGTIVTVTVPAKKAY
ncbi:histidine kinase [Pseudoduganella sp. FT55W]|uniref:Histidine kinase n=1 Tax=Duganella rivi TaxID=2666083 RepID=A0A7X4K9I8_9BURK|nr:sensor histidine kinase [Duganella rivi]MYM66021.1 histidine kinase [Duganella rivi]